MCIRDRKKGVYAHLELKGSTLSEAQKRMLEMYDEKKKKDELEKKDKVSSMMTKDSVKKEDEKEEEKPDMRSKYAMINIIKNKLRAAGQRDPMVMAVDACEEKDDKDMNEKYKGLEDAGGSITFKGNPSDTEIMRQALGIKKTKQPPNQGTMGKPTPSTQKSQTSVRTRGGGVGTAATQGAIKKPAVPVVRGAQGRTRRPTGQATQEPVRPIGKSTVSKPLPSTAEIRAANPGRVGGGNAGASADSGGTSQIPTRTTFTRQGKQRTKAQQMAADRIAAKKASPMDRQLSGRERAQQMARDRIAAKKAEAQEF